MELEWNLPHEISGDGIPGMEPGMEVLEWLTLECFFQWNRNGTGSGSWNGSVWNGILVMVIHWTQEALSCKLEWIAGMFSWNPKLENMETSWTWIQTGILWNAGIRTRLEWKFMECDSLDNAWKLECEAGHGSWNGTLFMEAGIRQLEWKPWNGSWNGSY